MGCFDNTPLEHIDACNAELVAGIAEAEVYAIIAEHIDTDQVPPAIDTANATLEQLGTISGDITVVTGKGFFKLAVQSETGEVKDELVGNKGNKKVKSSFDFFVANTSAQNIGFLRRFKNTPMVFLVKEKSGRVRKLGSKSVPIFMDTGSMTTGKGPEDDTGMQVTLSVVSSMPAPVYGGAIAQIS